MVYVADLGDLSGFLIWLFAGSGFAWFGLGVSGFVGVAFCGFGGFWCFLGFGFGFGFGFVGCGFSCLAGCVSCGVP